MATKKDETKSTTTASKVSGKKTNTKVANKKSLTKVKDKKSPKAEKENYTAKFLNGYNGDEIYLRSWLNVKNPVGVVIIVHGMVEHGLRYNDFANFLNENNYLVFIPDLRGHGKTAGSPSAVGKYQGDIFGDSVQDIIKLADYINKNFDLPLFVLGHSYGSFIAQRFIQKYHNFRGAILSGSASFKGDITPTAGKVIAWLTSLTKGKDAPARLLYNMSFGAYGKNFENKNWLSSDEKVWDNYNFDPYCGKICSANFYRSFFKGIRDIAKRNNISQIDKGKSILITSGQLDPVSGKKNCYTDKLVKEYLQLGIHDIKYLLWENGRHEILNETFKQDVYNFILNWLNEKL